MAARGRGRSSRYSRGVTPAPSLAPADSRIAPAIVPAIAAALALLALIRMVLAFAPDMSAWGINLLRFASSPSSWLLAAAAVLASIPGVARRIEPALARLGPPSRWTQWGWALAAAVVVALLPDRTLFVGDSLLRSIASHTSVSGLSALYPQGFPLDALLHDRLPRFMAGVTPIGIAGWWRLLGALEAAALAWLAVRLARTLGLSGASAVAVIVTIAAGGYLTLFTGYSKAFAEMVVLVVAMGVFGVEAARHGTGLLPLSAAFAAALLVHRLGIALLPAWAVALLVVWRRPKTESAATAATVKRAARSGTTPATRRRGLVPVVGVLLPLVALAVVLPHMIRAGFTVDVSNFLPEQARRQGVMQAALAPRHLLDLANALLFLAPLALLAPIGPFVARGRRAEALVLGALALPLLLYLPFFHPPQGLFRDWDALAPSAAALTVLVAWALGVAFQGNAPARAWLPIAVALGALGPAVQTLRLHHDPGAGLERLRSFVQEPPPRNDSERATVWDFLGSRYLELGLVDSARTAFAHAAHLTPSPRILREWATSELMGGHPERALDIYRQLLARKPDDVAGLIEYAILSQRAGDLAEARRAAETAARLAPQEPQVRALLEQLSLPAP